MFKRIACEIGRWYQRVMSGSAAVGAQSTVAEPAALPRVPLLLGDVPGGQPNLLPVSALLNPLVVEVPQWTDSNPEFGEETVTLFWNNQQVEQRHWTTPISPQDLLFEVPAHYLREGRPVLHYQVVIYNGAQSDSAPLTLTIDLTAPALATLDDRLKFDSQVITAGVTEEYLLNNGDQLLAELPAYTSPMVGDRISYYWDRQLGADELVEERVLEVDDLNKPLQLVLAGDLIRERGDGQRHVHYRISDRAGNQSRASAVITLAVKTTPAPRILSRPELPMATGTGETVVLDLNALRGELEARIPEDAGVGRQEPVVMQWGEPGTTGAVSVTGSPGTRAFAIPYERLAAHSGKTIPLYYTATGDESSRRLVRVLVYKPFAPSPQVLEASVGSLSLAKVGNAATITQELWPLASTDQRVKIIVRGGAAAHTVVDSHAVTQAEIDAGLLGGGATLTVPKTFLQGLALNTRLLVQVSVSLDTGVTWPSSRDFELQLTLVA